jgi:uncharacterized protein YjiS (DUF1127 family)
MSHTDVIGNRSGSIAAALRDAFDRFLARLEPALVIATKVWIARHDERILMQMPDYLLKDIGIGRADIRRAVRQGRT